MRANRAVVDTNVFVAALLGSVTCRAVLAALEAGTCLLCISPPILTELADVVSRSKFRGRFAPETLERLHHVFDRRAKLVHPTVSLTLMRDAGDNRVLECAAASDADVLITGDRALLDLRTFGRTEIMLPADFLTRLTG